MRFAACRDSSFEQGLQTTVFIQRDFLDWGVRPMSREARVHVMQHTLVWRQPSWPHRHHQQEEHVCRKSSVSITNRARVQAEQTSPQCSFSTQRVWHFQCTPSSMTTRRQPITRYRWANFGTKLESSARTSPNNLMRTQCQLCHCKDFL